MDMDKIYKYKKELQDNLTFEEISKLYKEILYNIYEEFTIEQAYEIHCYQLLRDMIDIFTQMVNGREFGINYLKDKLKW